LASSPIGSALIFGSQYTTIDSARPICHNADARALA
jgi:hypothetical protein